MALLERYLSTLAIVAERAGITATDNLFLRLLLALFTTALAGIVVLVTVHVLCKGLSYGIEYMARNSARGARTDTIQIVERYCASTVRLLERVAISMLKPTYPDPNSSPERLPSKSQKTTAKVARKVSRCIVRIIRFPLIVLAFIRASISSLTGSVIVVVALSMAFPDLVRNTVASVAEGIESLFTISISPGALLTAVGTALTIALIVIKVFRSERARASRQFMQEWDDEAIRLLHEFVPIAAELAATLEEHIDRTVVGYQNQRNILRTWTANITGDKTVRMRPQRFSMHTECDHMCLQPYEADKSEAAYPQDLRRALEDYHKVSSLRRKMADRQAEFARLFTARAWEWYVDFVIFRPSMGSHWSSTKRQLRLPGDNEWYEVRVRFQHDKLQELSKSDANATYEFNDIQPRPDEAQRFEDRLFNDVWEMCKARRQLSQLVEFGDRLFRKTRAGMVLNRVVSSQ